MCFAEDTKVFDGSKDRKRKRDFAAKKSCEILFLSGKIRARQMESLA